MWNTRWLALALGSLGLGVLPGAGAAPGGALRRVDLLAVAAHVVLGAGGDGPHAEGGTVVVVGVRSAGGLLESSRERVFKYDVFDERFDERRKKIPLSDKNARDTAAAAAAAAAALSRVAAAIARNPNTVLGNPRNMCAGACA